MRKLLVRNQPDAIGVERVEELIHVVLALGCAGLGEGEERHRLAELAPRHEAALVHVEVLEEVDHAPNVPMKHLVKRCNARGRAGRRRRPATAAAATAAAAAAAAGDTRRTLGRVGHRGVDKGGAAARLAARLVHHLVHLHLQHADARLEGVLRLVRRVERLVLRCQQRRALRGAGQLAPRRRELRKLHARRLLRGTSLAATTTAAAAGRQRLEAR